VVVVVSPIAGLLGDQLGFRPLLVAAALVFGASAAMLGLSSFSRVRVE
jgi:MFS family permease